MAVNIGPRIGIDGEAEYRKAINQIIQQGKTLKTEMDAVSKGFREAGDESSDFERKSKILNEQIETQKELIEKLKDGVLKSAEATGENSEKTLKWQQSVNKAQGELADLQNQLKELVDEEENSANSADEVTDSTEDLGNEFDKTGDKTNIFAETLKSQLTAQAIIGGIKAIADAVKETAEAIKEAINETVNWADDLATLSTVTGISTTELQKMEYMSNLVDVDVDTITGSLTKLTNNMQTASEGTSAASKAFEKLGVSVTDSDGNLRNNQDVFYDTLDALGQISNVTERDALAMDIFGKSAQDLNPLISAGADTLKELGEEAVNTGYVLSEESLGGMLEVSDAFDRMQKAGDNAKRNAIAAIAPALTEMLNTAVPVMQEFAQHFSAMFSGDMSITDFTTWLMEQINSMLTWVADNVETIISIGSEIIIALMQGIGSGDLVTTAMEIVANLQQGIADNLPDIIDAGIEMIVGFVQGLTDPQALGDVLVTGTNLLITLVGGIVTAIPQLIQAVPSIIKNLVQAFIENAPMLLASALALIVELGAGLIESIPELLAMIPEIILAIIQAFAEADWLSIGTNIMDGIGKGLLGMVNRLVEIAKNIGGTILSEAKKVLGIASPSKRFRDEVGKMIPEGIEIGIDRNMPSTLKDMQKQMDSLVIGANSSLEGISAVAPSNAVNNYGGFTINVNATDGQSANDIAEQVMYRIQNAVSRREAVFA